MKSVIMIALLASAALQPLGAQQVTGPRPAAAAVGGAPAASGAAGPRLEPQWRSYEPRLAGDSSAVGAGARSDTHTVRYTTLTLVLVVVILVLLIA